MTDDPVDAAALGDDVDAVLLRLQARGRPIPVRRDERVVAVLLTPEHLQRLEDLAGFAAAVSEGLADSDGDRVLGDDQMGALLTARFGVECGEGVETLRWTIRAKDDAIAIGKRVRARDADAARLCLEQLQQWARYAARAQDVGRIVPELGRADVLEVIVGDYRVLYRTHDGVLDVVQIVDVWP